MHGHELLPTIAFGLIFAFIGGLVARWLRLPAIVGFLVAGIAVGPFTPGFTADQAVAMELAELGIVLLMFGVGLHFSLHDLWSVRRVALPGAVVQIAVATVLGTLLGIVLGYGATGGLVLGLAVSVASTVVLLRALEERHEVDTDQGRVAIGWLIVEDLFTVLVLVLLPTFAALGGVTGGGGDLAAVAVAVLGALARAAAFVAVMFFLGTRLVPWLLLQVAREGSRELFTLAVLAIALGIAFVSADLFGVSLALGAFLAGAVLAGSDLSHRAAADALPLRDAFAVLFFVAVGMLVDPAFLVAHPLEIAAIVALIVIGKGLAAYGIVALLGRPARTGLTVSAGLAQIGEFSFIVATLAVGLGLLPDHGYQLVVAGALVSITINPVLFAAIDPLERRLRGTRFARRMGVAAGAEPASRGDSAAHPTRRHAVVLGYGRVGSLVGHALERRGFPTVIIEHDRRRVEHLREDGHDVLYGEASDPTLLRHAGIDAAAVLVVAIADAATTRLAVERARSLNPRLPVVVRTHSEREAQRLAADGRVMPVVGERELAVQVARLALRRFGVSGAEAEAVASGLRRVEVRDPVMDRGPLRRPSARLARLRAVIGRRGGERPLPVGPTPDEDATERLRADPRPR